MSSGAEQQAAAPEPAAEQKSGLIEIYIRSNALPKELIDLQNAIGGLSDVNLIEKQIPELSKQVEEMEWQATNLKSNPDLTFREINLFEEKLVKISTRLDNLNATLTANIDKLDAWSKIWAAKDKEFQEIVNKSEINFELTDSLPDFFFLSGTINTGRTQIDRHLHPNLVTGHEIAKIQTRIYALKSAAGMLIREMNELGTQQTSPSMLSGEFYKLIDGRDFVQGWENIRIFARYQWDYLRQNLGIIAFSLGVVLALTLAIYLTRPLTGPSSIWYVFASRPVITSIFIFCSAFSIATILSNNLNLPPNWDTLVYLPLILAVWEFVEKVCRTAWLTSLCRHLLVYLVLSILLSVVNLPRMLTYVFVFYASVILLAYHLIQFLKRRQKPASLEVTWTILIWGVFPLVVIIAGVSGYVQLAVILFGRVLTIIAATIAIRLVLLFISGLLELLLNQAPWKIIKNNAATIVEQVNPLLALLHFMLWLAVVLNVLWIYPTLNAAFAALTSLQFTFYTATVTPGAVLSIVLIIYITLLISRGLQAFLLQEVLPAHEVEKGAQISIARLVHYAILTIGSIVLLRAMGFGVSQLTILGGALGVGIGFGLQAIVNNFVSGLILLFERPIKVGDIIDVGTQVGEVKELGLRATTVQTFDNAEIVIPNSQLITGSLTNWTLAEKKIRIKVPIGVAYGSDITLVLKILLACAEANPRVMSAPKPAALFLAFGASSLDFELLAWIHDFNDRLTVLSELNQDIEVEFESAGIEIPFPQTDLHLRSIDPETLQALTGSPARQPEQNSQGRDPEPV